MPCCSNSKSNNKPFYHYSFNTKALKNTISNSIIKTALITMLAMIWSTGTWAQVVTIPIETAHNALVLQSDQNKDLKNIYLGKKLDNAAEYNQIPGVYNQSVDYTGLLNSAYTPSGSRNLVEPAITVT